MISGIRPSKFKEAEIDKSVEGMLERRALFGKPVEYVACKRTIWMPYYRLQMGYWRSEGKSKEKTGERVPAETALNAMLCRCINSESELLMIFRPNYLRHEAVPIIPASDEAVGPAYMIDFERVLSGLVNRLNEVQDELSGLRSTLNKNYVRKRRFQMLLPMANLREEKELSARIAKLEALRNTINMCLNIDEKVGAIEFLDHGTFYCPTSVCFLKNRENGNQRFLIVPLVGTGGVLQRPSCDVLLTRLCSINDECGKLVAAAVAGS